MSTNADRSEEMFMLRIKGKGVVFERSIPGWIAASVVLWVGRTMARNLREQVRG